MTRIIIFSDSDGWHEQQLNNAFAKHNIKTTIVSLKDCRIGSVAGKHGIEIPAINENLPDAAFIRAVPGGGFEEVSFRLDILHALNELGVLTYNNARTIERTVDKAMTTFLLSRADIDAPHSWVCESYDDASNIIKQETQVGLKLVLKPLFGNCGRGLLLIDSTDQLPHPEEVNGVYYLQSYIAQKDQTGRDWRVLVINGCAVAAMERVSEHWITNRARGGKCLPAVLTDDLRQLAEDATLATGAHYAGVDIIADENNQYLVLEVNSVPAWRGLQSVCPDDIAKLLVDDLLHRLHCNKQGTAVNL